MLSFLKMFIKIPIASIFGIDDALIFGGMAAAGGIGGSLINASSARDVNAQQLAWDKAKYDDQKAFSQANMYEEFRLNQAAVGQQREYETQMANSAYQRATQDMEKAGINPMLAYMKGGAETPSTGTASARAPSAPSGGTPSLSAPRPGDALTNIMGNLTQMMSFKKDMQSKDAAIALTEAQAQTEAERAKVTAGTAKKLGIEIPALEAESKARIKHGKYDTDWAAMDAIIERLRSLIPFTSPKNSGKPTSSTPLP